MPQPHICATGMLICGCDGMDDMGTESDTGIGWTGALWVITGAVTGA